MIYSITKESFLSFAYFLKLSTNLSHCPLLRFKSTYLPTFSMCSFAKGSAYEKKWANHISGGTEARAKYVKYAETTAPRYPTGLWWVILPVYMET